MARGNALLAALLFGVAGCEGGGAAPSDAAAPTPQVVTTGSSMSRPSIPPAQNANAGVLEQWRSAKARACGRAPPAPSDMSAIKTADFNGDGATDLMIALADDCVIFGPEADQGGYGRAGPLNEFYVSGPDGYRIVEGFLAWPEGGRIERAAGGDRYVSQGGFNGRGGSVQKVVWAWDGSRMKVVERFDEQGRKVDEEGYVLGTGKLPIARGFWISSPDAKACFTARSGTYYDGEYWGELSVGSAAENWVEKIGTVGRSGRAYIIEDLGVEVRPVSDRRISVMVQDEASLHHCGFTVAWQLQAAAERALKAVQREK